MKAVYAVFFRLESEKEIEIGAMGTRNFQPGIYVYVGSAMNSVEKRVERHFSETENLHWHIDYFSSEAEPFDYFVLPEVSEYECVLAEVLEEIGEPMDEIGSTDCECGAHLFRIRSSIT